MSTSHDFTRCPDENPKWRCASCGSPRVDIRRGRLRSGDDCPGRREAPEGHVFLVIAPYAWGKDKHLSEARRKAFRSFDGGKGEWKYAIGIYHKSVWIDEFGRVRWDNDHSFSACNLCWDHLSSFNGGEE